MNMQSNITAWPDTQRDHIDRLDMADRLNNVKSMMDLVFLAASGLDNRRDMQAIQTVLDVAGERLRSVIEELEIRTAGDEGGAA